MDLVLAGGETQLLESLDFSLKPQANYVQSRFCLSFWSERLFVLRSAHLQVHADSFGRGVDRLLNLAPMRHLIESG